MDTHLGMHTVAVISAVSFFLSALIAGAVVNDPVHSKEEIDNFQGDETDPRSKYRGKLAMLMINGGPTGLVTATSIFNFLFPIVNLLSQIDRWDLLTLKQHFSLYVISLISAYIVLKNVARLMLLKTAFEKKEKNPAEYEEKRDMQYYIVKQYLLYNCAIIYCWYFLGTNTSNLFAVVLFLVVLTIDDWNTLSKYLEFIPASKIKKTDLVKMLAITIAIPIFMLIELAGEISWTMLEGSYSYFAGIVIVIFLWTWIDLIRLSLKYYRLAEEW